MKSTVKLWAVKQTEIVRRGPRATSIRTIHYAAIGATADEAIARVRNSSEPHAGGDWTASEIPDGWCFR